MLTLKKTTTTLGNLLSWIVGFVLICFGIMVMVVLNFLLGFTLSLSGLLLFPPFRRIFGNQIPKIGQFGVLLFSALLCVITLTGVYYVVLAEPIEKYLEPMADVEFDATMPDMDALQQIKEAQDAENSTK